MPGGGEQCENTTRSTLYLFWACKMRHTNRFSHNCATIGTETFSLVIGECCTDWPWILRNEQKL